MVEADELIDLVDPIDPTERAILSITNPKYQPEGRQQDDGIREQDHHWTGRDGKKVQRYYVT